MFLTLQVAIICFLGTNHVPFCHLAEGAEPPAVCSELTGTVHVGESYH